MLLPKILEFSGAQSCVGLEAMSRSTGALQQNMLLYFSYGSWVSKNEASHNSDSTDVLNGIQLGFARMFDFCG
jgi:hypothetical protein